MDLQAENLGGVLVISVPARRIDAASAIRFKDSMRSLTENAEGRIILDLSQVDFIDSSGLGAIVAAMKQLDASQILELASLSPTVEKVFRLTRMDSVFTIHADTASATEGLRRSG